MMIRKTAAITAASIAGVVVAGGAAIGANIGILAAADSSQLGSLSAETVITTPASAGTDTSMPTVTAPDASDMQIFAVDAAGTVAVETTDSGLRLGDVVAITGWEWQETSSGADTVTVSFVSGPDSLDFVATSKPDGTIAASVERRATGATATIPATAYAEGEEHEAEGEYEDESEHEEDHENAEHEGRDDDD